MGEIEKKKSEKDRQTDKPTEVQVKKGNGKLPKEMPKSYLYGGLLFVGGEGGVEESACTSSGGSFTPSSQIPPALRAPRALRRGSQSIAVRLRFSSAMLVGKVGNPDDTILKKIRPY